MHNPFSLQGKIILVTGASSGIGRSIAIETSKMGATLILLARNTERLNETLSLMDGDGHMAKSIDLTNQDQTSEFFSTLPKLDGVVFSAGILKVSPAKYVVQDEIDEVFKINVYAPMNATAALLELNKINKGASILFLSSVAATLVSQAGNSIYGASKAAILSYSKVLATELGPRKIRVNCISPGIVQTDLLKNFQFEPEQIEEDQRKYPLGYGRPVDVAYAAIYLLSEASVWVTGSDFVLDGGRTLQ